MSRCRIRLKVIEPEPVILQVGTTNAVKLTVADGAAVFPHYKGEYTVSPSWEDVTLETRNHILDENVEVLRIQKQEASNPEGGLTLTI